MSDSETNPREGVNTVFSETNVTIILWFIVVYLLLSSALNLFRENEFSFGLKMLDIAFLLTIVSLVFNDFYSLDNESRKEPLFSALSRFKDFLKDYTSIFSVLFIHLVLFIVFKIFQLDGSNLPGTINFVYITATLALIILLIVVFIQDILGVPLVDNAYNAIGKYFEEKEEEEVEQDKQEEVFNVSNNLYTYDEAPHVCNALGGRLATYDEVEEAYNKGGEWCNYGWSQDQLALFPTQKDTWKKLKNSVSDCDKEGGSIKNSCGRPGINGGYIANPKVKFGVNCFGIKPEPTESDKNAMEANKDRLFPKTRNQMATDRKVEFWKENADKLLTINSYNKDTWSRY